MIRVTRLGLDTQFSKPRSATGEEALSPTRTLLRRTSAPLGNVALALGLSQVLLKVDERKERLTRRLKNLQTLTRHVFELNTGSRTCPSRININFVESQAVGETNARRDVTGKRIVYAILLGSMC